MNERTTAWMVLAILVIVGIIFLMNIAKSNFVSTTIKKIASKSEDNEEEDEPEE